MNRCDRIRKIRTESAKLPKKGFVVRPEPVAGCMPVRRRHGWKRKGNRASKRDRAKEKRAEKRQLGKVYRKGDDRGHWLGFNRREFGAILRGRA